VRFLAADVIFKSHSWSFSVTHVSFHFYIRNILLLKYSKMLIENWFFLHRLYLARHLRVMWAEFCCSVWSENTGVVERPGDEKNLHSNQFCLTIYLLNLIIYETIECL